MRSKRPRAEDVFNLERFIKILETPFSEVCQVLGLDCPEPEEFIEVGSCVFLFDPEKQHVFSGAVILDDSCGFFGIRIGANWLETAGRLESEGFVQADSLERFTRQGPDFGVSIYLYPNDCANASISTVKDYSICPRYSREP
jgi:hypothetical protein